MARAIPTALGHGVSAKGSKSVACVQDAFALLRQGQASATTSKPAGKAGGARPNADFSLNARGAAAPAAAAPADPDPPLPPALAAKFDRRLAPGGGVEEGAPWWRALQDFVPLALLRVRSALWPDSPYFMLP